MIREKRSIPMKLRVQSPRLQAIMHLVLLPFLCWGGGFTTNNWEGPWIDKFVTLTNSPNCLIKNCFQTLLSKSWTFKVFYGSDVFAHCNTLRILYGGHATEDTDEDIAYRMADWLTHRSRSLSIVAGSSRKSSLVPTKTMEVDGAWWDISGYH